MKRSHGWFQKLTFVAVIVSALGARAQNITGQMSRVGEATHLEFSGLKDWPYDLKRVDKQTLSLVIPAFDEATELKLRTWSDPYVKSITINKNGPDHRYILTFHLAGKEVESFDYFTDDPSRLIVDFYKQAPEPKAQANADAPATVLPQKLPAKKVAKAKAKGKSKGKYGSKYKKIEKDNSRKPASDEILAVGDAAPADFKDDETRYPERGIFDANDPEFKRFQLKDYQVKEEAIIASRQNIYIEFPPLVVPMKRFDEMMKERPEYEIHPKDTKENKEARLLLELYKHKRFGSFSKVYDYYIKKYPQSPYDEIVRNLAVEMHIDRYLETNDKADYDLFLSLLKYLAEKYPESPLRERNQFLSALATLKAGENLEALRQFEEFLKQYPKTQEADYARMGIAGAYVGLAKPADAIRAYENLEKNALDKKMAVQAAYRVGDVQLKSHEYKKAAATYEGVLKKYPEYQKIFPNAQYNLSECYFWLKDYKKSLDSFIEFLRIYPNNSYGGFALTRVGEILDILGADQSKVMGAFIEGYFRYPNSQGSEVARIRMLSQGLKGMKEKEMGIALKEIADIQKRSTLPRMDEFVTLMVAEGLSKRHEYRESLDRLLTYFQHHPAAANIEVFKGRILRNIADVLKVEVDKNNFMEALAFYGKYAGTWLKNSSRFDTDYFHARAYEQAGVFDEASKGYLKLRKSLRAVAGKPEEKKRRVYEYYPELAQVNLRLAAVSLQQKKYRDAYNYLEAIKGSLDGADEVERVQIGAAVAENTGDIKSAIRYLKVLVDTWKGQPQLLSGPYLKLAELYLKSGDYPETDKALTYLQNIKTNKLGITDDQWARVLELKGDYQVASGAKLAAVETYMKLLDAFETKRPLESIRYKAGQILFEEGDLKGAEKIWSGLTKDDGEFYKKLAEEKLQQSEWQENYKKYIDRIPAAQTLK